MKLEFSRQIFEKYSDFRFNENQSSGRRVFPCVRTDGHTDRHNELNDDFLKFAYAPENVTPS